MISKVQFVGIFGLIVFLQIVSLSPVNGQEKIYEAQLNGQKAGEIFALREVNDENVKIYVNTNLDGYMLFNLATEISSESMYVNQSLMQATSVSKVRDRIQSEVQTVKMKNSYSINANGDSKNLEVGQLLASDILFFEEPLNINSVYSLALGKMLDLVKSEAKGEYYFEYDGNKHIYRYLDGTLQEVEIKNRLYDLVFKLKK